MRGERIHLALSALAAGAAISTLVFTGCGRKPPPAPPAPPEVLVAPVEQRDVPIISEWTGSLAGSVDAQIRAQVSGYLMTQAYREGSKVKQGELLFEIDPRPFQAVLAQAEAQRGKTELDVKRLTPLAKEQAVSQEELDDAVQADKANQAAVDAARLNLGFTKITSPIEGIAGIATADVGDLVGPTTGDLTAVSTVDPIKAYFTVSEQEYLGCPECFACEGACPAKGNVNGLELILADGSVYPRKGTLYLADRQVDPRTGTLKVAALFPNPNALLRPGQFARVRAVTRTQRGALLVPQRAVTELQGNYQVAIVGADDTVAIRPVAVGERIGSAWIIRQGVQAGERVVVEGIQKARQGAKVTPKPYAPDKPSAAPKP